MTTPVALIPKMLSFLYERTNERDERRNPPSLVEIPLDYKDETFWREGFQTGHERERKKNGSSQQNFHLRIFML